MHNMKNVETVYFRQKMENCLFAVGGSFSNQLDRTGTQYPTFVARQLEVRRTQDIELFPKLSILSNIHLVIISY